MKYIRICLMALLLIEPLSIMAQLTYPANEGDKVRYNLQVEIRDSFLSGICIMVNNDGIIASSIVNEFGISLMDFIYSEQKDKVKLCNMIKPLDRWYVKRLLKRSLKGMLKAMKSGDTEYIDEKNRIKYVFTLNNEAQG
mgnify:CR=1 FL=1